MKNLLRNCRRLAALAALAPVYFGMPIYAQDAAAPATEKKMVKVKMIRNVDGKTTVVDTTFESITDMDAVRKLMGEKHPALRDALNDLPEGQRVKVVPFSRTEPIDRVQFQQRIGASDSLRKVVYFNMTIPPGGCQKAKPGTQPQTPPAAEPRQFRKLQNEEGKLQELKLDEMVKVEIDKLEPLRSLELGTTYFKTIEIDSLAPVFINCNTQTFVDCQREVRILKGEHGEGDTESTIILVRIKKPAQQELQELQEKNENIPTPKRELPADKLDLNLYPNPSNGRFTLNFFLEDKGNTAVRIYDELGREVYSEQLKGFTGNYSKEIDLSTKPKGIYFVQVMQGKSGFTRKIVLE